MASTTADGKKVRVEADDGVHPDKLYTEAAFAELHIDSTQETITMAATAAVKDLGTTAAGGSNIVNSVTAKGVTVDAAAGTFTVDFTGTYRLYLNGQVSGEEDEDVTLEFQNNAAVFDPDVQIVITYGIATTVEGTLTQLVSKSQLVDLDKDDVVKLTVLGSNSEVVTFADFSWGLELVCSETFEND